MTLPDAHADLAADGTPEPWRAEGAVLVAHLLRRGAFTAEDWAAALAAETADVAPDFPAWVRAVTRLMARPGAGRESHPKG